MGTIKLCNCEASLYLSVFIGTIKRYLYFVAKQSDVGAQDK